MLWPKYGVSYSIRPLASFLLAFLPLALLLWASLRSAKELDKKLVKKQSEKEGFPDKEGWPDTHNLQRASSVSAYKEATKILTDKVWGYLIAKISF